MKYKPEVDTFLDLSYPEGLSWPAVLSLGHINTGRMLSTGREAEWGASTHCADRAVQMLFLRSTVSEEGWRPYHWFKSGSQHSRKESN